MVAKLPQRNVACCKRRSPAARKWKKPKSKPPKVISSTNHTTYAKVEDGESNLNRDDRARSWDVAIPQSCIANPKAWQIR